MHNMRIFVLSLTLILLILTSCNKKSNISDKNQQALSINTENCVLQTEKPALSKLRYIKLETKQECLLEDVTKVVCYNNKLYILSALGNGNVYIFDDKGNFQYKLNKGEGPEDIMYPTDIAINEEKNSLVVLDLYRNIKEFNAQNGDFLKNTTIKEPFLSIETIGSDFLLFDPNTQSKSDFYLRYLQEGGNYNNLFPKVSKGKLFSSPNFFTKINSKELLVSCIFSDTIYHINNDTKQLAPYLILDFQENGANRSQYLEEAQSLGKYMKNAKDRKLITGPRDLSHLGENLFFTLNSKDNYFVTFNAKENKAYLHTTLFDGLPNIYVSSGRTDKEVIFTMDIPWLMEYFKDNPDVNSDIISQLKQECNDDNDNPVLLFGSI